MPFYPDTKTFYAVMTDLFGRVIAAPEMAQQLRDTRAVLCIKASAPDGVLSLDARSVPARFAAGEGCTVNVDLGFSAAADTLHAIWLGETSVGDAFAAGKIKLETNPLRAFALLGKFEAIFWAAASQYPAVLREHGLSR